MPFLALAPLAVFAGLFVLAGFPRSDAAAQGSVQGAPGAGAAAVEFMTRTIAHTVLLGIRSQVDLTWSHLGIDPWSGDVTLTNAEIRPDLPHDPERACIIRIDRLTAGQGGASSFSVVSTSLSATGIALPSPCLEPEARGGIAGFGYTDLVIDTLAIDIAYDFPSSAADVALTAAIADAVRLQADARFGYVSFVASEPEADPEPIARLDALVVTLENDGLWQRALPILTNQLGAPDSLPAVAEAALLDALSQGGTLSPGPEGTEFARSLRAALETFVVDQRRLVVRLDPEGEGVWLDDSLALKSPPEVVALLNPTAGTASPGAELLVPPALLAAALSDPSALAAEERIAVGRALLAGVGAPRALAEGRALLAPLAEAGDGLANLALASALADAGATADAYAHALRAAAAGETDALGLLDRLEPALGLAAALDAQRAAGAAWVGRAEAEAAGAAALAAGDVGAMRARAVGLADGRGAGMPRDYRAAYLWASLAAAGGDGAAALLRDRLDRRFEGEAGWAAIRTEVGSEALRIWVGEDLASRILAAD